MKRLSKQDLFALSASPNTRRAYSQRWRVFEAYCTENNIVPLESTTEQVIEFFLDLAQGPPGVSVGTLAITRSAIKRKFLEQKSVSPTDDIEFKDAFRGLSKLCSKPLAKAKALRETDIAKMLSVCADTRIGLRDAVLLSVGFTAALRRSELVGLLAQDIKFLSEEKCYILIRQSKTDQLGAGQTVAVMDGATIKAVTITKKWLTATGIESGPLLQTFRKGGAVSGKGLAGTEVSRTVKKYARRAGLSNPNAYSAHSLRAGFVTSAAIHGARIDKIMEVTRHKNPAVLMGYIRSANAFDDHAAATFL